MLMISHYVHPDKIGDTIVNLYWNFEEALKNYITIGKFRIHFDYNGRIHFSLKVPLITINYKIIFELNHIIVIDNCIEIREYDLEN